MVISIVSLCIYVYVSVCVLLCVSEGVSAQRNVEAEGMCQPFLTSNFSSPLIPDIRRNLKIDEGE
jgi:hypothetical protein